MVLIEARAPAQDFAPDCALVSQVLPSPNHGERRGFARPDSLVLHCTEMSSADAAIALLRDSERQLSSHYVVDETGRIVQLVPEARRAWHAGVSCWRGERDMNSASIGIEICNLGHAGGLPAYPQVQIEATVALCLNVAARNSIRAERVLAHSDIAPSRKRDPGEKFPWGELWRAGVGHWTNALPPAGDTHFARGEQGPAVRGLQTLLSLYGYDVEISGIFDARTEIVVAAFQRHFRTDRVDGVPDASTLDALRRLIAALPAHT